MKYLKLIAVLLAISLAVYAYGFTGNDGFENIGGFMVWFYAMIYVLIAFEEDEQIKKDIVKSKDYNKYIVYSVRIVLTINLIALVFAGKFIVAGVFIVCGIIRNARVFNIKEKDKNLESGFEL